MNVVVLVFAGTIGLAAVAGAGAVAALPAVFCAVGYLLWVWRH